MASVTDSKHFTPSNPPSDTQPDLSIVLVCWNNKDYLEPCLNSLYGGSFKSCFDVAVVDNGSTDGSQEMLREKFPEVKIIQNDHNVGLSKASNQGILATQGRYVLLLNNDTLVNSPSLDAMARFMNETSDAGAVGGVLLNPDGSFQSAGIDFSSLLEEFLIATRLGMLLSPTYPSFPPDGGVKTADWLSSACLLLRREALNQIGLLDEDYFIYGDEADLQYRLHKKGWKVYFLPDANTIHFGGRSMDRWRRRKMVYRGKMLFYEKNYGPLRTGILRIMLFILSLAKLLVWGAAFGFPRWRERAQREIDSNLDVIKLCLNLK
jgi:GT2 family glycosyltransferase